MENKLKFGISTTVLREHPVSYALEQIARAGYRSAEVWTWHLELWDENPKLLSRRARELELTLTMHAPADKLNPTAEEKYAARQAQGSIATSLELAMELEVEVVAIHPGRRSSEDEPVDDVWERLFAWVYELDKLADRLGLKVGLELMEMLPLEIFMLPNDAAHLMDGNFDQIGLTVDIAHMNTHMDPVRFLKALDPVWIIHAHLSDNDPRRVHLPLGEGNVDLSAVLEYLEQIYNGVVSIEGSIPGQGEGLLRRNMSYLNKLGYG
jgi:sugar phosphate isomerase/epimerase